MSKKEKKEKAPKEDKKDKKEKGKEAPAEEKDAKKPEGAEGEASAEGAEGEAPKKSKKKLIIIIVAVLVLVGGGVGGFLVMSGGDKKPAIGKDGKPIKETKDEKGKKGKDGKEEEVKLDKDGNPIKPKPVFFDVPDIIVNLNSTSPRPHFVNLKLTLDIASEAKLEEVKAQLPRITDSFNTYLREVRREDLQGSAGTYRLKKELTVRLNKILGDDVINEVLIREIIVQ